MFRRKLGTTLAACGIVMLMFGLGTLPAQGAEPARPLMQPSPRPAINPVRNGGGGELKMGHVTGTVIDLTTGAPVAGISVNVGGDIVTTDANGNYDHWLPVGSYTVALELSGDQGTAEQGAVPVLIQADTTTVQHLSFRSPLPPTATPFVQAAQPALAQVTQPTATTEPTATHAVAGAASKAPPHLPRTGDDTLAAWWWLAFGMVLLFAGLIVGFAPVMSGRSAAMLLRAHAADSALLRSLLSAPIAPSSQAHRPTASADDFLQSLLEHDERTRQD